MDSLSASGFRLLPEETLIQIGKVLNVTDLWHLMNTCSRFLNLYSELFEKKKVKILRGIWGYFDTVFAKFSISITYNCHFLFIFHDTEISKIFPESSRSRAIRLEDNKKLEVIFKVLKIPKFKKMKSLDSKCGNTMKSEILSS